jgi:hypothetical protein
MVSELGTFDDADEVETCATGPLGIARYAPAAMAIIITTITITD